MQARPPARAWAGGARWLPGAAGVCLLAGALLQAAVATRGSAAGASAVDSLTGTAVEGTLIAVAAGAAPGDAVATEAEARAVCGVSCHRFPPPDILPRAAWRNEILLMARLRDERLRDERLRDERLRGERLREDRSPGRDRQDVRALDEQMAEASMRSAPAGQPPLAPPLPDDLRRVLAFYERHAPKALPAPDPWPDVDAPAGDAAARNAADRNADRNAVRNAADREAADRHGAAGDVAAGAAAANRPRFVRRFFAPDDGPRTPAVSHVRFADVDGDARLEALGCDMRYGLIFLLRPYAPADPMRVIAQAPAPAHVTQTDVDRDGLPDLLVADLGAFQPSDRPDGSAIWLRAVPVRAPNAPAATTPPSTSPASTKAASNAPALNAPAPGASPSNARTLNFLPTRLAQLPRVADVESADLDRDGLPDLIVSAFGWRRTGALSWWRASPSSPTFTTPTVLDPRPGAIHTIPVDLDDDEDVDLVSVIAQEHEEVLAWLNDGRGRFDKQLLYAAPHPNWGSSGIQVVDLDNDHDLDVLLAHGDMFDDFIIKPYHGVQWLENRGTYPFTPHTLATLPGVHRAIAIDLDLDRDLDIVASALIPEEAKDRRNLPSLVWLEQIAPGRFVRHTLERGTPRHPTLDAADFDNDGDIDLLVGNMVGRDPAPGWVELWENVARLPGATGTGAPPPPR